MGSGPEFLNVEKPLLDQLGEMGWKTIAGSFVFPSVTGRASFRDVILKSDLAAALRRVNLRDGEPWLDDGRVSQAVSALERSRGCFLYPAAAAIVGRCGSVRGNPVRWLSNLACWRSGRSSWRRTGCGQSRCAKGSTPCSGPSAAASRACRRSADSTNVSMAGRQGVSDDSAIVCRA